MAITPASFARNPRLLVVTLLAAFGLVAVTTAVSVVPDREQDTASAEAWALRVELELDRGANASAYALATKGLRAYPGDAQLLNLRGFAAARAGDYHTAANDFRTGLDQTGSPYGVFENNLAWSTLYTLDALGPRERVRALGQTRTLLKSSLEKGRTCERMHTAMYIEYAIAEVAHYSSWHGVKMDAIRRYQNFHANYSGCEARVTTGDELVVEEVVSAAVMDLEMGRLAGVIHPNRHVPMLDSAVRRADELGVALTADWCERANPLASAVKSCARLGMTSLQAHP